MLTIQFVPYTEIEGLNTAKRVQKLLKIVKEDKIVILEGKLKSTEEAELIRKTMEEITDHFKGVEIATIQRDSKHMAFFEQMRALLANVLLGDRQGLTLIGPANLIKEIKKDPDKIQLLLEEAQGKKRR